MHWTKATNIALVSLALEHVDEYRDMNIVSWRNLLRGHWIQLGHGKHDSLERRLQDLVAKRFEQQSDNTLDGSGREENSELKQRLDQWIDEV